MALAGLNAFGLLLTLNLLITTEQGLAGPSSVLSAGAFDAEEMSDLTEGDMVLSAGQRRLLRGAIEGRNGLVSKSYRWPNRTVFYKIIGADFDRQHIEAIKVGIQIIESYTCLKFRPADETQPHYVAITSKPGGCYTAVGYQAKVQQMNLQPYPLDTGCFRTGTILHEFMHALGFYHEQSSADRDEYIRVVYENIVPGKEFNFQKYASGVVTDFGVGYDYDSCLHYRPAAFSVNGGDTIIPLDPGARIGQRRQLSRKDIDKINIMYKCLIKI